MSGIQNKNIRFQTVIDALLDDDADFPESFMLTFSDIDSDDFNQLVSIWNQITPERKANLFENLEIINETDTLVNFQQVAQLALGDPNAVVRASGIRMLWDYEEEKNIPVFIALLKNDIDMGVRSEAAGALGKFVYLGEIEEISQNSLKVIEETLLKVMHSSDSDLVRQRALDSLGFSSHAEVPSLIMNAYQSGDADWLIFAISAMGRSADDKWSSQILAMLAHPELKVQIQAVKAAGELELKHAKKLLTKFVLENEFDEDIWVESVWALSKIGGDNIQPVFQKLLKNAESEEEELFLQEAMDNLDLTNGIIQNFEMMGLTEPDSKHMHEYDIEGAEIDLDAIENSWLDDMKESLEEEMEDAEDDESDEDLEDELEDGFYEEDVDSPGDEFEDEDEEESDDDEFKPKRRK